MRNPAYISGSGALHAWMGRSFEHLCLQHALEISRAVGFSTAGVQVDLVFDRADNVLTVCEMKYSANTVGGEVIASMKRKLERLQPVAKGKTVQPVLVVRDRPSQDLIDQATSTGSSRLGAPMTHQSRPHHSGTAQSFGGDLVGKHFPGAWKTGCFSRSLQGFAACGERVARMATPGLRGAWDGQRNVFTAAPGNAVPARPRGPTVLDVRE